MTRRALLASSIALWLLLSAGASAHIPGCNSKRCDRRAIVACKASERCSTRVRQKGWHRVADPYWGIFQAIASCESHWHWHIEGYFSGGLQFTDQSWRAVGGSGRAGQHTVLEQIYRAVLLRRLQGYGAWPNCRKVAGV